MNQSVRFHFRVDNVRPLHLNYCVNVATMSSWQAGELGLMNEALRACASEYILLMNPKQDNRTGRY